MIFWLALLQNSKSSLKEISGSWDPAFTDATQAVNGIVNTGNYNQIGKMMFFCINVQFSTTSTLGTGIYQITLPKPARQTFTSRGGTLHNQTSQAKYHIAGIVESDVSNTIMKFYYTGSTTDLDWKYNTPVAWSTSGSPPVRVPVHFDVSGFYEIAE